MIAGTGDKIARVSECSAGTGCTLDNLGYLEIIITIECSELEEGTRVALCLRLLPVAKSRTFGSNFDTLVDMEGSCACGEPGFDVKTLPVDRLICSKRRILR